MGLKRYCCLLSIPSHTPYCATWPPTFVPWAIYLLPQPLNISLVTERAELGSVGSLWRLQRAGGEKLQGKKHAVKSAKECHFSPPLDELITKWFNPSTSVPGA